MKNLSIFLRKNFIACAILSVFVFGSSIYVNCSLFVVDAEQYKFFPPFRAQIDDNRNRDLGVEYFNIASAIVNGRGFSDPFGARTGPTAWMPPLYPYLLSALLSLFDDVLLVTIAVVLLKDIAIIAIGLAVYSIAQKTLRRLSAYVALSFYALWVVADFRWFFQGTHDDWVVMSCLICLYVTTVAAWQDNRSIRKGIFWGASGGLATLSSPVLGAVWVGLWIYAWVRHLARPIVIALIIFAAINIPWTARNYKVFDTILPVKANLFFDACLGNVDSRDGLVNEKTFWVHPCWLVSTGRESGYSTLGEKAYLEGERGRFISYIRNNPYDYLRKIKNRILAATVRYHPYRDTKEVPYRFWRYILHPAPFISLLFLSLTYSRKRALFISVAIAIYVAYLLPYLFVQYYIRYSIPLLPIKALLMAWAIDRACSQDGWHWRWKRSIYKRGEA